MLALHFTLLALAASAPGLEMVETRVNLTGGSAIGGQSVLHEQDWIYRKPLLGPPTWFRPTWGLYGSWTQPLPPTPAHSDPSHPKGPLFHAALGAVFTAEAAGLPLIGEKWFGGQIDAGISLFRREYIQVILGTRALMAGASPADAWDENRAGFLSAALTLAFQDLQVYDSGLGYRVTSGGRYYTRYRDRHRARRHLMPVLAVMILAPTRSGFYPFLEFGTFPGNPVVLGVGRSL